jgi:Probable zinc-ribbon domain
MSGKRRHNGREAKAEAALRQAKLDALACGKGVVLGALAPHRSYDQPDFVERGYYVDKPFVCQRCGISQVWTAAQQKWWYEVAKGPAFSTARRCRSCRQRERALRERPRLPGRSPSPYRSAGQLLAKIRSNIEPNLLSAGYRLVGGNSRGSKFTQFLDYSRPGDLFTISWDRGQDQVGVVAELLSDSGADLRVIAAADLSNARSTSEIEHRLVPFIASVQTFLDGLREAPPEPESQREP